MLCLRLNLRVYLFAYTSFSVHLFIQFKIIILLLVFGRAAASSSSLVAVPLPVHMPGIIGGGATAHPSSFSLAHAGF